MIVVTKVSISGTSACLPNHASAKVFELFERFFLFGMELFAGFHRHVLL
jgi:hypothetical protein